jgi:ABC-type proline/glycine betaine transport system ATPase subunit
MKPLTIEPLMDFEVQNLSGGELQRVALALCLGQPADIYLIDEPSAYLDSEQRIMASKVIKRFIMHSKKTAFIVEHDFIMATYLADRVIVYEGQPSRAATARTPQSLLTGMNLFLRNLDITFRRDPTNYRPRINKHNSTKDREQKEAGTFYYIGASVCAPMCAVWGGGGGGGGGYVCANVCRPGEGGGNITGRRRTVKWAGAVVGCQQQLTLHAVCAARHAGDD